MHKFDLKNRTAIVTGGAQGFGYAIVKRFIDSGANVIIWDIDKKFIDLALKEINNEKLNYQIVDITNYDEVINLVKRGEGSIVSSIFSADLKAIKKL